MHEQKAAVVDIRHARTYNRAHVPGSSNAARGLGPRAEPADRSRQRQEAPRQLLRLAEDNLAGYLGGGVEVWQEAGLPASGDGIEDLVGWILSAEPMTVLECGPRRMGHGHVPGAVPMDVPACWSTPASSGSSTSPLPTPAGTASTLAATISG
jgi:rhodanese-related sulfurtransferase